jgi:hypothetical protein
MVRRFEEGQKVIDILGRDITVPQQATCTYLLFEVLTFLSCRLWSCILKLVFTDGRKD